MNFEPEFERVTGVNFHIGTVALQEKSTGLIVYNMGALQRYELDQGQIAVGYSWRVNRGVAHIPATEVRFDRENEVFFYEVNKTELEKKVIYHEKRGEKFRYVDRYFDNLDEFCNFLLFGWGQIILFPGGRFVFEFATREGVS